ncbi:MAG: hypothetical protein KJO31_19255 [Gammaproteobacteria bacterium]|nr:hypothetical protein [Gammaproteobacteria bacterium]
MNQIVKRFAKGVAWSVIVLAGSGIAATPDASAHGVRDSRFVINVEHRNRHAVRHMPRWLRRNYNFRRWYVHQQHRLPRRASWGRLYEMYLYDTRRFRRAWHRRFDHGHDWRDQPRRGDRDDNRRRRG